MKNKQPANGDWAAPLQSLIDIAMINFTATQKIAELQSNFVSYLLDQNLKQFQAISDAKDPQRALELQLELIKKVDTSWCNLAEKEIKTARDVQCSVNKILEQNIHIPEIFEQFNNALQKH